MIRKKICLLGAPGVGKTSLVRRFVSQTFSDDYLTTIGVKIERRKLDVDGEEVQLLVWDIHGEEGSLAIAPSFLAGAAGHLLVVDGSRPETVSAVLELRSRLLKLGSDAQVVVALNKADLVQDWTVVEAALEQMEQPPAARAITSAKTGDGVEDAFQSLGRAILSAHSA